MKILYFDVISLLYPNRYVDSSPELQAAYDRYKCGSTTSLLENVTPDIQGVKKLQKAAQQSGLFLYPAGSRLTRDDFIGCDIFDEDVFAPDIDISAKIALDDGDPIRRLIAHAGALGAEWYICGDVTAEKLQHPFQERYLSSIYGEGVTDDLVHQILSMKQK